MKLIPTCLLFLVACTIVASAQTPFPVAASQLPPVGVVFTVEGVLSRQDSSGTIFTSPILLKIGEEKSLWSLDLNSSERTVSERTVASYSIQFIFSDVRAFAEWYQSSSTQILLSELKQGKGSYFSGKLSMRRATRNP